MRIEIAKNVIEHLKKFPFGYPSSSDNDEWKLLETPFSLTDEEGELLCQLRPYSEHIDEIVKRLGRSREELQPILDGLLQKTWLLRTGDRDDGRYTALTWGPGAMELQMPWLSKELLDLYGKLKPLDATYSPDDLIPHFRVVPRESAVSSDSEVLPSEMVTRLIDQADDNEIAVTECICRKIARIQGKGCGAPIEDQCLFLGAFAVTAVEIGAARRVTKGEAKKRIRRAQELGLVHQANANARPLAICSCCTCCCGTLRPLLAGRPQPSLKSNFHSEVDVSLCKGTCPDCARICPAKALTMEKTKLRPVVDSSKCIGCGLCVTACPEGALALRRNQKSFLYPDTWDDYLHLRARQSGRTEFDR